MRLREDWELRWYERLDHVQRELRFMTRLEAEGHPVDKAFIAQLRGLQLQLLPPEERRPGV